MLFNTKRLTLRHLTPADLDVLHAYRNHSACLAHQRGQHHSKTALTKMIKASTSDDLITPGEKHFAIALKSTGGMIGDLYLSIKDPTYSLGCTVAPEHQRQGYAHEIIGALVQHLHKAKPSYEFVALTDLDNLPGMHLLEKLGFHPEGYLPEKDSIVFSKYALNPYTKVKGMALVDAYYIPYEMLKDYVADRKHLAALAEAAFAAEGLTTQRDFAGSQDGEAVLGLSADGELQRLIHLDPDSVDGLRQAEAEGKLDDFFKAC